MDDISVGEYVRTKNGIIDKVINPNFYINIYIECEKDLMTKSKIKKHSPNIIDLIEVGDYVNGEKVFATDNRINDNGEKVILTENYDEWTDNGITSNKDIKSIVTKEMMKSIEYRIN